MTTPLFLGLQRDRSPLQRITVCTIALLDRLKHRSAFSDLADVFYS